jgi:hypothetical protein
MASDDLGAGRRPASATRPPRAKPPGSAKRSDTKAVRTQLHLGESTVKRLGVHCSLERRNASRVADDILIRWLAEKGSGRELFPALDPDGKEIPSKRDGQ